MKMNKKTQWLDGFRSMIRGYVVMSATLVLMMLCLGAAPIRASTFSIDTDNSFFFGQRGAGIDIDGTKGLPNFGHPSGEINSSYVELHGQGQAETSISDGHASEILAHDIMVYWDEYDQRELIDLHAGLELSGEIYSGFHAVTVNDNSFNEGSHSYADAWAKTVLNINPEAGESLGQPVTVHIFSHVESYRGDLFTQETLLGGGYPNNFRVLHNDDEVFNADELIYSPNGDIIDDLIINAVIGDTITVDAAVVAKLGGNENLTGDFEQNPMVNFTTGLYIESTPVPIPGAVWLLGSGLLGLVAVRRRKGNGE